MKIFVICSKAFYDQIPSIKLTLENKNNEVFLPNCYDKPQTESLYRGTSEHASFKQRMYKQSKEVIEKMDAVLVLNYNKNGIENYIGGATFLEMYDACMSNKKIYLMNPIPKGILEDEIIGFSPTIINGNLDLID